MNFAIPVRLIAGSICFLYLILPIPFVSSIREILLLPPIENFNYFVGIFYSLMTFLIVLLSPKCIIIKENQLKIKRPLAKLIAWLCIFASAFIFLSALNDLDNFIYLDKIAAHLAYEELNAEHGLRFKYNILLCIFLLSNIKGNMQYKGALFFLFPTLFEVIFSKHNYATHLLTYLFLLAWNSNFSRKTILVIFSGIVAVLLGVRFAFYSDFQSDPLQSLAAIFGEFTISWQSIPAALNYTGPTNTSSTGWYSDILSSTAGLDIGLAGNPVAEAIFFFKGWAGIFLILSAFGFVLAAQKSRNTLVGSISMLVTTYYLRDCFRTGWSLGISVYAKSFIIFSTAIAIISIWNWLFIETPKRNLSK